MARVQLELPEQVQYRVRLSVRITDINYGGHLGNQALLGMLHEARVQLLNSFGLRELDHHGGVSLIMTDSVIIYRGEAFAGEELEIAMSVGDFNKYGFDVFYAVHEVSSGREIARAKTGMLCFDYQARRVLSMPEQLQRLLSPALPAA